jgi:hypothetical protein
MKVTEMNRTHPLRLPLRTKELQDIQLYSEQAAMQSPEPCCPRQKLSVMMWMNFRMHPLPSMFLLQNIPERMFLKLLHP